MKVQSLFLDEVDSTNTYARTRFDELADGTLVISSCQTAGRGRRGRVWLSPRGINIYASLVVKSLDNAFLAGALAGLAVLDTVRNFCPEAKSFLKWPNDVYVEDRKISGILCESAGFADGKITGIVAGMGLNVNLSSEQLSAIDQPATSLRAVAGIEIDVKKVADRLEKSLNQYYITGLRSEVELYSLWKRANRLIGQRIELIGSRGERYCGVFADIAPDGEMILALDGEFCRFCCGDVRIDRSSIDWNKI